MTQCRIVRTCVRPAQSLVCVFDASISGIAETNYKAAPPKPVGNDVGPFPSGAGWLGLSELDRSFEKLRSPEPKLLGGCEYPEEARVPPGGTKHYHLVSATEDRTMMRTDAVVSYLATMDTTSSSATT